MKRNNQTLPTTIHFGVIQVLLIFVFLFSANTLFGQTPLAPDLETKKIRKNSIYYEFGGLGLASINYSRYFSISPKHGFALSAGVPGLPIIGLVFIEGSYITSGPKHFFEIGYGYEFVGQTQMPRFGYRYQATKGFLFRIALLYVKEKDQFDYGIESDFLLGLSLGYSF